MADTYLTIEGDTLDDIAFKHYGRHGGTTEAIYEANRGLAAYPLVLPAGLMITLPEAPQEVTQPTVTLYD